LALNNYIFAMVRRIIRPDTEGVIGDDSILAYIEIYPSGSLDLCVISPPLRSVIREDDLVVVDISLVSVPSTDFAAPKREIVKILRNNARKTIEATLNDWKTRQSPKPSGAVG